ncbi:Alpha/beta hydrolase family protein [Arthrobacter ulcerisalmonis]|uniref:Alpha/beta hydrolase family protein n=1 Tax=Arthrobacter ulcerisalmonis TaxID=2483813 RepID=A0A3P5X938_9MICC|nr:alpha/beta hydrolase [Arthrobacter ulcerisalmonis]VDC31003.1 Alpha/beta hydrolase family protein [Arthrobacter ulcerisalmonis]
MAWESDVLGEDFQSQPFASAGPDGVERTATLVRYRVQEPSGGAAHPQPAVLFLHGWSDYFFNPELARFWTAAGYRFYALDMHNHGRSLQPGRPGGYVADLKDYDAEIQHACALIDGDGGPGPLTLMGHSTGGLVAALWASRNQTAVSALVLNSPWLETHGSHLVRRAAAGLIGPLAQRRPETVLKLPERGFYWRTISSSADGEWDLNDSLRPPMAFPVRVGWLKAILAGHADVAAGLNLRIPVLVLISHGSANGMIWSEEMRRSDAVLDVRTIAIRSLDLGASVTVERIEGALHDVFLSPAAVRAEAYQRLARWLRGYGPAAAASTAPP